VSRYVSVLIALLLCGCLNQPCVDESAEAPAKLTDAPLVQDGGQICFASPDQGYTMGMVTVMYWGDEEDALELAYRAGFEAAGWVEGFESGPDILNFRKGDVLIQISLSKGETPRFGHKFDSPSLRADASWYDLAKTD
jgi:hypothetical protein